VSVWHVRTGRPTRQDFQETVNLDVADIWVTGGHVLITVADVTHVCNGEGT
jgi:hypothetical protein